jgi:integrase
MIFKVKPSRTCGAGRYSISLPLPIMFLLWVTSGEYKWVTLANRRSACATRFLRMGTSLKEIADFLGHRDMNSVSIYAKHDTRALRKVAAFRLAGLR